MIEVIYSSFMKSEDLNSDLEDPCLSDSPSLLSVYYINIPRDDHVGFECSVKQTCPQHHHGRRRHHQCHLHHPHR